MPPTPSRHAPRLSAIAATAIDGEVAVAARHFVKAAPLPSITGKRTATINSSAPRAVVSMSC